MSSARWKNVRLTLNINCILNICNKSMDIELFKIVIDGEEERQILYVVFHMWDSDL